MNRRTITNFNGQWLFSKDENFAGGQIVDLPHCYNSIDGQDGGNDYYRGTVYYKKEFDAPELNGDGLWLELRGVSQSGQVFLNGELLASHPNGYSTFRADLTGHLKAHNTLVVTADNSASEVIYPQKADFTFYGGIYRDVYLIRVPSVHFALDHYGDPGIRVDTKLSDDLKHAEVTVVTRQNGGTVTFTLGGEQQTAENADGTAKAVFHLDDPHLWNGKKDPFLYTVTASLDSGDEIRTQFGIRTVAVDPERGFLLNGKPYRLAGVSKHQDRWGKGNAVSLEDLEEDMSIILELGVTGLRLAHYQHAQEFYDLCDRNGLLVWAEIPYITAHMTGGRENTVLQMTELIEQNRNHPSIVCWGLSNEISTHGGVSKDLMENHEILNDLAHRLDPSRPTTMAHVFILKTKEKLVRLPDVCAYNLYYGWYVGDLPQNDKFLDTYHRKYPHSAIGLSEFGADANIQYQTSSPAKGDYTEAYQCLYHEHILKMWAERPWIWCLFAWNLFDFGADARNEGGKAGQNQKGLVTFDRKTKKDAFYVYKAYFSDEPFVHLCGKRYVHRTETETEVKVYTNCPSVTLYVDGQPVATKQADKAVTFSFPISGTHTVRAEADGCADGMTLMHTEEADPSYSSDTMKIRNWFDIEVKKGYFSLKDSAFRIKRNPEGKAVLDRYFYPMLYHINDRYGDVSSGVKIPKIAYTIAELFPLDKLIRLLGTMASLEAVEGLGAELPKIKK